MPNRYIFLALVLSALLADSTFAQTFPRRERGTAPGAPRDDAERRARQPSAPQPPADPIASIERELPSLKTDLRLAPDQVAGWNAFERDVREVAEMGRARRRHVTALLDGGSALTLVEALAEDDRMRAEAMADLRSHLKSFHALLGEEQRRLLDRRLVQSQTDPLGR